MKTCLLKWSMYLKVSIILCTSNVMVRAVPFKSVGGGGTEGFLEGGGAEF